MSERLAAIVVGQRAMWKFLKKNNPAAFKKHLQSEEAAGVQAAKAAQRKDIVDAAERAKQVSVHPVRVHARRTF